MYKNIKKYLSAEIETLSQQTSDCVEPDKLGEYHEFIRAYADIFSSNIYNPKDYTYHDLKLLIKSKDVKVLQGDRDSSIIIIYSKKYCEKEYIKKPQIQLYIILNYFKTSYTVT